MASETSTDPSAMLLEKSDEQNELKDVLPLLPIPLMNKEAVAAAVSRFSLHNVSSDRPRCRLPQPPDGRVFGCGQFEHPDTACSEWKSRGVNTNAEAFEQIRLMGWPLAPQKLDAMTPDVVMSDAATPDVATPDVAAPDVDVGSDSGNRKPDPTMASTAVTSPESKPTCLSPAEMSQSLPLTPASAAKGMHVEPTDVVDGLLIESGLKDASELPDMQLGVAAHSLASGIVAHAKRSRDVAEQHRRVLADQHLQQKCRIPQPPDGRWTGCGLAVHGPTACEAWRDIGVDDVAHVHERLQKFKAEALNRVSTPSRVKMCSMRQPPDGSRRGCGNPTHPDRVCTSWNEAGVLTLLEARQRLLEWSKARGGARRKRKREAELEMCALPQPPDGSVRGCGSTTRHEDQPCPAWLEIGVNDIADIRGVLFEYAETHKDASRSLCQFPQPPDGKLHGCGGLKHSGKICATWALLGVPTRRDAKAKVRQFRAEHGVAKKTSSMTMKTRKSKPESSSKMCNVPQPPDGRVVGCGRPYHRLSVCYSWHCFGVTTRAGVREQVRQYRRQYGVSGSSARVCRALQPPDGRTKGCGHGWHRGCCVGWRALGVVDRKLMQQFIRDYRQKKRDEAQSQIEQRESDARIKTNLRRRLSFVGISRCAAFASEAHDPDSSVRAFIDGDFDGALNELTRRILQPDQAPEQLPLLYANRGVVYAERGWDDLALRDLDKALQLEPDALPDARLSRALSLLRVNRLSECVEQCSLVIGVDTLRSDALMTRALALYEAGRFDECNADCRRLLDDEPDNGLALSVQAIALAAAHRLPEALHSLESASKLPLPLKRSEQVRKLRDSVLRHLEGRPLPSITEPAAELGALKQEPLGIGGVYEHDEEDEDEAESDIEEDEDAIEADEEDEDEEDEENDDEDEENDDEDEEDEEEEEEDEEDEDEDDDMMLGEEESSEDEDDDEEDALDYI